MNDLQDQITAFSNRMLAAGHAPSAVAEALMARGTSIESERHGPAHAAALLRVAADQLQRIADVLAGGTRAVVN